MTDMTLSSLDRDCYVDGSSGHDLTYRPSVSHAMQMECFHGLSK